MDKSDYMDRFSANFTTFYKKGEHKIYIEINWFIENKFLTDDSPDKHCVAHCSSPL